jgi:hypothetical protein
MQSACAVLFCHMWPVPLYSIFPRCVVNGTILGRNLLNVKCVFLFSIQLLSNIFRILRRIQRDITNVKTSSCEVFFIICKILMKFGFCREILEKSSNIKLPENPPSESRVVPWVPTDGRTDITKVIVAFRNFANAPENWNIFTWGY